MTTENTTLPENTELTPEQVAAAAAEADKNKAPLDLNADGTPKEPAKVAATANSGDAEVVVYNPTGDVGLDLALKYVGEHGFKPDHPAMQAAMTGDFSLLEAELAGKGAKGYEAYIKLGTKAFGDITSKNEAKKKADREGVEQEVGGAENWTKVQAWAKENADDGERSTITAALAKGGLEARMAAAWLNSAYSRANGISDEGPGLSVAKAGAKGGAAAETGALSPRDYGREVAKARAGFKGDFEASSVYKQLQQRRMAYRG